MTGALKICAAKDNVSWVGNKFERTILHLIRD